MMPNRLKHMAFYSLFFYATSLCSQSFYVSTTGNNANAGTETQPWRTIQHACNSATAGSTVYIKQGTYTENIWVNVSGTAGNYITFTRYSPTDVVVIDGGSTNTQTELLNIADQSYLKFSGLQFRNAVGNFSKGIVIRGSSHHIEISQNTIDNIHFSNNAADPVTSAKNANALLVYGDDAVNTITNITLDGNTITNCRTGFSEALTVNGNVSDFEVRNNLIHDITNIGIDIAGHFGACPDPSKDQARNGKVFGNTVYKCRSSYAVSAGIYVDGGKDLIIERNTSYQCGRGFEIGCENVGKSASNVTLRENIAYANDQAGIGIGGYNYPSGSGKVINCLVHNNSLYGNAVLGGGYGELLVEYTENCSIKNNIFSATSNRILTTTLNSTGLTIDYNLWHTTGTAATATVDFNGTIYTGFTSYKSGTGQDAHSLFANPNYFSTTNLRIQTNSPAINAGDPSFVVGLGETDFDGENRFQLGRVDIGADEQSVQLPIELLSFTGYTEGGKNNLIWTITQTELGGYFDIERQDGQQGQWETIGRIEAEKSLTFNFCDKNPLTHAYYRLKMVDNADKITFSKIIGLENSKGSIVIYPSHTEGVVFIDGLQGQSFDVQVFDGQGRRLIFAKNTYNLDLTPFANGAYQIVVQRNNHIVQSTKVVLQK
ncbi:MAG: right-handed parallel beta-helix repeat-containing protein [Saprospiraceae bacterium]|nr:right-handed parallel beta-helix repeat-containing protein [Saprospiraceae bacterium]